MDFQSLFGLRGANQTDDNLHGLKGNPLPIAGDVAEEPVLDFVPLAGSRWVVAKFDNHSRFVGQLLQSPPPQSRSRTVAAATVGRDQQALRLQVTALAQTLPPGPDRFDREFGRVT